MAHVELLGDNRIQLIMLFYDLDQRLLDLETKTYLHHLRVAGEGVFLDYLFFIPR